MSGIDKTATDEAWARRAHYSLAEDYTLNHIRDPYLICGIFLKAVFGAVIPFEMAIRTDVLGGCVGLCVCVCVYMCVCVCVCPCVAHSLVLHSPSPRDVGRGSGPAHPFLPPLHSAVKF